jgi:hypothetical protein
MGVTVKWTKIAIRKIMNMALLTVRPATTVPAKRTTGTG